MSPRIPNPKLTIPKLSRPKLGRSKPEAPPPEPASTTPPADAATAPMAVEPAPVEKKASRRGLGGPTLTMPKLALPTFSAPKLGLPKRGAAKRGGSSLTLTRGRPERDVVGLDIEPGFIVAAQATANGSVHVTRAVGAPIDLEIVRDGEVLDAEALGAALVELFRGSGLGRNVRVGLANQRTVLRTLDLPPIEDQKELAAAVRFQAEEEVPMPLNNAVLDFQPLGLVETAHGMRQRVVLVAAQRDMVERLLHALQIAGLRPVGVDLSAFAMIRALYRKGGERGPNLVYLSVGGLTNMAVADGITCKFTRVLSGGLESMAENLAARREVPVTVARELLFSVGLPDDDVIVEPVAALDSHPDDAIDPSYPEGPDAYPEYAADHDEHPDDVDAAAATPPGTASQSYEDDQPYEDDDDLEDEVQFHTYSGAAEHPGAPISSDESPSGDYVAAGYVPDYDPEPEPGAEYAEPEYAEPIDDPADETVTRELPAYDYEEPAPFTDDYSLEVEASSAAASAPEPAAATSPAPTDWNRRAPRAVDPNEDIHIVVSDGVREIAGEVRNSLDFQRIQGGGEAVEGIVLSGPVLDVPGFAAALERELGLPLYLGELETPADGVSEALSSSRLAIAAGLSVEEVGP